jgi:hypothetical protein
MTNGEPMIEAAELIVAALSAGAAAGLTDTASAAVKDSYSELKALTVRILRRDKAVPGDDVETAEGELVGHPDEHREELVTALTAAGVGREADLVEAARKVLAVLDPQGTSAGKYRVEIRDSQAVQVGDNNTMTLTLGK